MPASATDSLIAPVAVSWFPLVVLLATIVAQLGRVTIGVSRELALPLVLAAIVASAATICTLGRPARPRTARRRKPDDATTAPTLDITDGERSPVVGDRLPVVVFLTDVRWDGTWYSVQHLAAACAGRARVLFVEVPASFASPLRNPARLRQLWRRYRRPTADLAVLAPLAVPPQHHGAVQNVNAALLARQIRTALRRAGWGEPDTLICRYPRGWRLARHFPEARVIAHLCDELAAPTDTEQADKARLLARADGCIAVSPPLAAQAEAAGVPTLHLPHGVDYHTIDSARHEDVPADLQAIPRPRLGFIGSLTYRLDYTLIANVARAHPDWHLVFVGDKRPQYLPETTLPIEDLPNVHLLGARPRADLGAYLAGFDTTWVPYTWSDYNRASNPLKVMEYLAAGRPTVSNAFPALTHVTRDIQDHIWLIPEDGDFLPALDTAIAHTNDPTTQTTTQQFAQHNTWTARANTLHNFLTTTTHPKPSADQREGRKHATPARSSADAVKAVLNEKATWLFGKVGYTNDEIRDAKRSGWWWTQARMGALRRRRGVVSGWAICWSAPGTAELVPVDVPRAGPGEVTVEIDASFVSPGTERAQYLAFPNTCCSFPMRPGYSAAGTVIDVGRGVDACRPGMAVAVTGAPHQSVVTVPVDAVFPIPPGVGVEAAALVQIGVICGQAVSRAHLVAGELVCGVGTGLVGTVTQRLALQVTGADLVVVAASRRKEATARRSGAGAFVLADTPAVAEIGAQVVFEASGNPAAVSVAAAAAAPEGRILLLGSPRGVTEDFPVDVVRAKGLRVVGAHVGTLNLAEERSGTDEVRMQAKRFLVSVSGGLDVSDLLAEAIDPREVGVFYRRLAHDNDVLGAYFDWRRLPKRVDPGRLLSLPDVSARGATMQGRPYALPATVLRRNPDPFAGASGHLRVGLLGCGDIAVQNAAAIAAAPNVELTAAFDPIADLATELCGRHGGAVAASPEALLDCPDVDAVLLSVPHHLHAPLAILAAEAGKHVLVEKPMAHDLASAKAMAAACTAAGVALTVCFAQRFSARALRAKELVEAGAIGRPTGAFVSYFADKSPAYLYGGYSGRAFSDWRASRAKAGGGVLIMNLCHFVDLLRHLCEAEVAEVTAIEADKSGGAVSDPDAIEDTISVGLRLETGPLATIFGSAGTPGTWQVDLRVWGTVGQIVVEPELRVFTHRAVDGLRTARWHAAGKQPASVERAVYLSRVATALDRGELPEVDAADGLATQAIIEAAYRSAETGRVVSPRDLLAEEAS